MNLYFMTNCSTHSSCVVRALW